MPSKDNCTLFHMQSILVGTKPYLLKSQTKFLKVPMLPELAVAKIWPEAMKIPGVKDHLPDNWKDPHRIDRIFFWAVVCTFNEAYVRALIEDSYSQRKAEKQRHATEPKGLILTDEVLDLLLQGTYESSKCQQTFPFSSLFPLARILQAQRQGAAADPDAQTEAQAETCRDQEQDPDRGLLAAWRRRTETC